MRSAWRGASTKWNNQVHKTAWSSCKNRAPLVSHATRSSFDREQSILRTRKPRCPSRSDRASRRTLLGRPAARYSPPRPHPCSSFAPLPFPPRSSPQLHVLLLEPFLSLERLATRERATRFDSLSVSLSLLLAPLAVSRSTRNAAIYTHVTRSSTAPPRSAREVDDSCTRAHATNFGEALSSRHFRCTGIPTMNELACVVIAPT